MIRLPNSSNDPVTGYEIAPQALGNLKTRPTDWSKVIVWHTHPAGTIGPSQRDLEHAHPDIQYLVVTIPTGEWRGFRAE